MSTPEIVIEVATTWIRFKSTPSGDLNGVNISYFIKGTCQEREFDPRINKWVMTAKYTSYDNKEGYAYAPRYMLNNLIRYIEDNCDNKVTQKIIEPIQPVKVDLPIKAGVELREVQVPVVKFLIDESVGFKPLALFTGAGKTMASIYSICKLGYPALISLGLLIDQWFKSILQFTDISRDDIYVVKGFDTLANLWKGIENGFRPKILLFSMRTLDLYAVKCEGAYAELPPYNELVKVLGIGVKVVDECHLNFNTNVLIDLKSNIKMNIYLSATYQRSSYQGRKIFDMVFPSELKFGEQFVKKYTTVYTCAYRLSINPRDLGRFRSFKGYNHAKYENYLVRHKTVLEYFVDLVIKTCLYKYFDEVKKEGQHCLILVQTQQFACALAEYLTEQRADTVSVFFAGSRDAYGKEENLDADIIVSTIKSCGVGRDIKNLKTCINTVSFSSPPQCTQVLGRLRELPNEETIFVDIYNTEIQQHVRHMYNRTAIYDVRAAKVIKTNLN